MLLKEKELKRFLAKINIDQNGCWNWVGAHDLKGYGQVKIRRLHKTVLLAHRISYQHYIGDISKNMYICHKCDNPQCVNPEHLFVGTHQDNMDDMISKGRYKHPNVKGTKNPKSKLTEQDVYQIIKLLPIYTNKDIGNKFNVSHSTISCIRRGKVWTHITGINKNSFKKYKSMGK